MSRGTLTPPDEADVAARDAVKRWDAYIQRLHVARHLAFTPAFGLAVATAVVTLIGTFMLLAHGNWGPIRALPALALVGAAFAGLGWRHVPRIEGMLADAANDDVQPWKCPALLEAACGVPFLPRRARFEEGLARNLATLTPESWEACADRMHHAAHQMLTSYAAPGSLRVLDGPALPALLDAIGRCERTEFIRRVEAYERDAAAGALPSAAGEAARRCGEALRARAKRDREAATLLRPAEAPMDTLLRPAEPHTPAGTELLVRPVEEQTAAPIPASVSADDTEARDALLQDNAVQPQAVCGPHDAGTASGG